LKEIKKECGGKDEKKIGVGIVLVVFIGPSFL
jgi:hypothetical protein